MQHAMQVHQTANTQASDPGNHIQDIEDFRQQDHCTQDSENEIKEI
jgi:hypothetical protein